MHTFIFFVVDWLCVCPEFSCQEFCHITCMTSKILVEIAVKKYKKKSQYFVILVLVVV